MACDRQLHMWLLALAFIGLIIRAVYAFTNNPLDFITTGDCLRHYANALLFLQRNWSFIDPIGYQLWLGLLLNLFGESKLAFSLITALLSIATPCLWYLWLKECIPSKTGQLAGFAAISLLLPWITIYSFFMTETLLLPGLGLALWLTWRAKRELKPQAIILAAFVWSCVLNIKITVLPEAAIALTWLFISIWKDISRRVFVFNFAISALLLSLAFLIPPALNFYRFGAGWLFPPGGILTYANKLYRLSGKRAYHVTIRTKENRDINCGRFDSFAFYHVAENIPFASGQQERVGEADLLIDASRGLTFFAPPIPSSLAQRLNPQTQLWLVVETTVVYFIGQEWPDCLGKGWLQRLQDPVRWLWAPMFLVTLWLAVMRRDFNIVVTMSILTAVCFCLQDWGAMGSGRYRKPWEGLAIAALVYLISKPENTLKDSPEVSKTEN